MNQTAPDTSPTTDERLEALEFLLGQTLLALEADSHTLHERIGRLEKVLTRTSPNALPPLSEEAECSEPFTMNGLGEWMQISLERMRAHRSVSARQMVAIGEVTARVLDLGESPAQEPPPAISTDAIAALERAKHRPAKD